MDTRSIFDSLVASSKQWTEQAKSFAESNLGLPRSGPERDAMLSNLGKGAAVGGLAAVLLGTKTGRKLSGKLVALGSVAAVGTVAYTAYQHWMKSQGKEIDSSKDVPVATLTGVAADQRGQLLVRAMIAASKADGVIDNHEQELMDQQLERMEGAEDAQQWLRNEMRLNHDVKSIAAQVDSTAAAAEVYLVSSLVIDDASPVEQAYLEQLRDALQLDQGLIDQINAHVS